MNSLREPSYDVQKLVNVHPAISKKVLSGNDVPSQFTADKLFQIFFKTRAIWCESFSESENHILKQVSVSCFSPKTKLLSENVSRPQNQIEKVLLHIQRLTKLPVNVKSNIKEKRFGGSVEK